ncbi:MAG: glycosyltransferase [Bacteroidota bacterium]
MKTVLICPLDWGLGHASRDVVIIKKLLKNEFNVVIGADKDPLSFLKSEFPELPFIKIPSTKIKYPKGKRMAFKMLFSIPKILYGIQKEHQQLKKIVANQNVNIVISDNRFGLWNKNIYSVFITHQLEIQLPGWLKLMQSIVNKVNYWFINKYDTCWIPDLPGENNLAGALSHPAIMPENFKYIGLLSRFNVQNEFAKKYEMLAIISGPEPQRSIFEDLLIKEIKKNNIKALIVRGKPGIKDIYSQNNIDFINHIETEELIKLIVATPIVISRSGYSSIMDYIKLKKNVILVPTPGQTEQEYLAKRLKEKMWFYSLDQNKFNLEKSLQKYKNFQVPEFDTKNNLLESEVRKLFKK